MMADEEMKKLEAILQKYQARPRETAKDVVDRLILAERKRLKLGTGKPRGRPRKDRSGVAHED